MTGQDPRKENIQVILEVTMPYPYSESFSLLSDYLNLWHGKLIKGSTKKQKCLIKMPCSIFKYQFQANPREGFTYPIPANAERMMESVKVNKVLVN